MNIRLVYETEKTVDDWTWMSSPAGIDIVHSFALSQEPKCMQTSWLQTTLATAAWHISTTTITSV